MTSLQSNLDAFSSLERLSLGMSPLHRVNPAAKILATAVYVLCVASLGRYELLRLAPFLFYPVLTVALAGVPFAMIFRRALVALPFCLFAGFGSLFFDRAPLFTLGSVAVSGGFVTLLTLACRAVLCVSAVLILVAVTPFASITNGLLRFHVPALFVELVEMVYRYAGVLAEEAEAMTRAFRLRSNGVKLGLRTFGPFVGQLLLRSASRAQRVHQAMQCRLYGRAPAQMSRAKWTFSDAAFLLLVALSSIVFRIFNLPELLEALAI